MFINRLDKDNAQRLNDKLQNARKGKDEWSDALDELHRVHINALIDTMQDYNDVDIFVDVDTESKVSVHAYGDKIEKQPSWKDADYISELDSVSVCKVTSYGPHRYSVAVEP